MLADSVDKQTQGNFVIKVCETLCSHFLCISARFSYCVYG